MTTRNDIIVAAAETTIHDGHVLHVRAERLPGQRYPKRYPMPAVDLTVGPDGHGRFLVVDYSTIVSGDEQRHDTEKEAIRAVRRTLSWERIGSLSTALVKVHGEPEHQTGPSIDDARYRHEGTKLRSFAESRPILSGPLFGPGFGPFGR